MGHEFSFAGQCGCGAGKHTELSDLDLAMGQEQYLVLFLCRGVFISMIRDMP